MVFQYRCFYSCPVSGLILFENTADSAAWLLTKPSDQDANCFNRVIINTHRITYKLGRSVVHKIFSMSMVYSVLEVWSKGLIFFR